MVRATERTTILPSELFVLYESETLWNDPTRLPKAIQFV
jgi:hypothetical protein